MHGTASESYYCDSIGNCVLLRSLGIPWSENETGIIDLANHLSFCPCLKRKNDQGLGYVIDTFQSGLEVNPWLQSMYNTLASLWAYMSLCHMRKYDLTYLNHQHLQLLRRWQFCCLDFYNASNGTTINCNNRHVYVDAQFAQNLYVPWLT